MGRRKIEEPPLVEFSILRKAGFTTREVHVLHYLQQGFDRAEIGEVLGLTPRTIAFHLGAIGKKLGARGKAEIIARAIIACYLASEKIGTGGLPLM